MKTIRWMMLLIAALLYTGVAPAFGKQENQPALVGHIDHVEGQLLRYVPENKDWVATVKDAPFGLEDALYADKNTRAEIIMPNSTMLRIGGSTQAQLLRMTNDSTEIDIASGKARFYNTSSGTAILATTPFGQVIAPAGSVFDLYVGDDSVEVIAVKAAVDYVHPAGSTKYPVHAGSSSIIATRSQVASGEGLTDASWNSWNADRDRIWARRLEPRGETARYVPPELSRESYVLEDQGRWESVYYDGGHRQFWRPTSVSAGWAPYTCGRWTTWYGDQVWIPAEPFGYVTHHYGSWVYVDAARCWYWAPPVAIGVAVVPSYTIRYGWYPGRVSWIYTETYVGWVPLAPYEPYYCHNYWGPSAIVSITIYDDHHRRHDGHHGRHHYEDHAVVVNQNNFYTVNNYNDVRVKDVDRATIAKAYRGSPVVNSMVIKNHKDLLHKYNFADINVRQKPHQTVLDRVQQNIAAAKRGQRQPASTVLEKLGRMKEGRPADGSIFKGRSQQVTDKMVSERDVNRPKALTFFPTRELKPSGQVRPDLPEGKKPMREKPSFDADRESSEPTRFGADSKSDQRREKPQPPAQPASGRPDERQPRMRPDRTGDKPVAGRPEYFQRPAQTDTKRPERPAPPVFEQPEKSKPEPRQTDDAWRPRSNEPNPSQETDREQPRIRPDRDDDSPAVSKPERYQRPEPRQQPRTIQQPRESAPEPRQQPRTLQQPRESAPEPRQQPRTIQQPRESVPEPRQHPRIIQQPRENAPEPRQQPTFTRPQKSAPVQQSPGNRSQQQNQQAGYARGFHR